MRQDIDKRTQERGGEKGRRGGPNGQGERKGRGRGRGRGGGHMDKGQREKRKGGDGKVSSDR